MQKKIAFEKGNLFISYCDNKQDLFAFKSGENTHEIKVTFIPTILLTEEKCKEYTQEIMPKIIEETKVLISENNDFYKNFEINYDSQFSGYYLLTHNIYKDFQIVDESWMRIDCKLIENKQLTIN